MGRSVDWVEQDLNNGTLLWRQGKRETGQYPVTYTDRRSDYVEQVVAKKATKKSPVEYEAQAKYSDSDQQKLVNIFAPLIKALTSRYGSFSWWHYDFPTGTLLYGSGGSRVQVTAQDIIKIADIQFQKFTKALSALHGKSIAPAREA